MLSDSHTPHEIINKQKIEKAMINRQLIKFDYVSADISLSRGRVADPLQIEQRQTKTGYQFGVTAQDMWKQQLRFFSFEGIQKLEIISLIDFYKEVVKK